MLSRPRLGVCTWIFGDLPLAQIAGIVAQYDYDGVALQADLRQTTAVITKQILADHNLDLFSLTPPEVDLANPDTAVRHKAIDTYLRLLDFAAEIGQPLVAVRGKKGRTRPITKREEEMALLVTAVQQLADEARQRDLKLVFELLNRYESHLVNSGAAAATFLEKVARDNVGLLLNAFHMNIEEQDAATTIRQLTDKMWLYHMADSNRQGIGRGHTKLGNHLWGLEDIGYQGPLIMEFLVPGADPIAPILDDAALQILETYLQESRRWF